MRLRRIAGVRFRNTDIAIAMHLGAEATRRRTLRGFTRDGRKIAERASASFTRHLFASRTLRNAGRSAWARMCAVRAENK